MLSMLQNKVLLVSHLPKSPVHQCAHVVDSTEILDCADDSSADDDILLGKGRSFIHKMALQWISRILVATPVTLQL